MVRRLSLKIRHWPIKSATSSIRFTQGLIMGLFRLVNAFCLESQRKASGRNISSSCHSAESCLDFACEARWNIEPHMQVPSHVPPRYVCYESALQACKLAELQMAAYGVFSMPHLCSFNSQGIGWKPSRRTITSLGKRYSCSIASFIGSSRRCSHDRPGNRPCCWFNGPFISRHVWDICAHCNCVSIFDVHCQGCLSI